MYFLFLIPVNMSIFEKLLHLFYVVTSLLNLFYNTNIFCQFYGFYVKYVIDDVADFITQIIAFFLHIANYY